MAGDYLPIDHALPDKPEFLAIVGKTGATVAETMFRLFQLWRMADRQTTDGVLPGLTPAGLAGGFGGDVAFWEAVADAGWLQFTDAGAVIPDFERHFSKCAKRRIEDAQRKKTRRIEVAKAKALGLTVDEYRTQCGQLADECPQDSGQLADECPQDSGQLADELQTNCGNVRPQEQEPVQEQEPKQEPEPVQEQEPLPVSLRSSTSTSDVDDQKKPSPEDASDPDSLLWRNVRERANQALKKLGLHARLPDDRSLMLKACLLVERGTLPEDWLADSIEAVRQCEPQKPWAFFFKCLENKAADLDVKLKPLLAAIEVPVVLLKPPGGATR